MPTLHRVTHIAVCSCAILLVGCAKKDDAAVDTTAMAASSTMPAEPAAPAPINLADVAGKWNMASAPATGSDTTSTRYVLTATGSTEGWTMTFPGRPPVPLTVKVDGDSINTISAQYASVRRKGQKVVTNGWWHLQNGALSGSTTAHYAVKTADSVLVLNSTGTRAK
jgi:polyisoprenoid-binding protein YceI